MTASRRRLAQVASHIVAAVEVDELPTMQIAGHTAPAHAPPPLPHYSTVDHSATADCRLTDEQRDECLKSIAENSFCILPIKLPEAIIERANAYITNFCDAVAANPDRPHSSGAWKPLKVGAGYSQTSLVELDPVFRELMTFRPAMQLTYDCFGPMFHVGQDKWTRKFCADDPHSIDEEPTNGIGWHSVRPHQPVIASIRKYRQMMMLITHAVCCCAGRPAWLPGDRRARAVPHAALWVHDE